MQTIALYDMMASAFEEIIRESDTSTKEAYEKAVEDAEMKVSEIARRLRLQDPIMTPYYLPLIGESNTIEDKDVPKLLESIKDASHKRDELGLIYTGACSSKIVQRTIIQFPKFVDFKYKPHVLIQPYDDQEWEEFAVKMMNQIILGCILALPKGSVRINFINLSLSSKSSFISNNLPSDLCRMFIEKKEIREFLSSMVNRIKDVLKNKNTSDEVDTKYEIVVLLDYPYLFDGITEDMRIIIEQGQQAGIHFIVLNDERKELEDDDTFDLLSLKDNYFQETDGFDNADEKEYDKFLNFTYQLCDQTALLNACIDYLNDDEEKIETKTENVDIEKDYSPIDNGLNVSIGLPVDKRTVEFCLGQNEHVHSFIIGQSGKGKSVLLNNIIIKAIQKYSPEDLQLYLLDCKLGGVEFNRYKEVKHVRALLVDNSDIQIILEILRDLSGQMRDRGKQLREAGVQKIDEYNKAHPDNRMSRIWVVIDECHVVFEQNSTSERKTKNEIIEILSKVSTEGRNQGVHLIMATQTLANADIPTVILNQITDRYILNCSPIDAEKMCSNSSRITNGLGIGDVYYHNTGNTLDTQFHAYNLSKEEATIQISAAVTKAEGHLSNGQFYFNGSLVFHFNQEIIETIGKIRKQNLKACAGRSISLKQEPVLITLKQDMSENILLTGIDDQGQSMRTAMDLLVSLIACNIKNGLNYKFYVFDLKDDEEGQYLNVLERLEDSGIVSVVRKREQGPLLKKLVDNIRNNVEEPTILMILGQQRFRELKMDVELGEKQESTGSLFGSNGFVTSSPNVVKTFKDALSYILDNGPDFHIHTILQVDKPDNILFEDYITGKFVFKKFRHLILLRSDDKAAIRLGIPDEIRLDNLNGEQERLRAVYYADGDDGWTLFSPFAIPDKERLSNIISKL